MTPASANAGNSSIHPASNNSQDYQQLAKDLQEKSRQLELIAQIQSRFIREPETRGAFELLLSAALGLTDSAYGFAGEILFTEDQHPYLRNYAITDIAWNAETKKAYADQMAAGGMEFYNMSTLFGHCIVTGEHVLSNDPANDPRAGNGLPPGHLPLNSFLGLPIRRGESMIGMIGLANRSGGYTEEVLQSLEPMVATFATLIDARRAVDLRNQYEAEILSLNRRLEKQVGAMDANVEGMALLDKGLYSYMNPAHARIYGYEVEDLIGESWQKLYASSDLEIITKQVFPILQSKGNWRGELTGRRVDGTEVDVLVSLSVLPDEQLICSCSDISERKRMQADLEERTEALRVMNEDLKSALQMKDQFTASMSHELRTPLNAILGYAELLETGVGGELHPAQEGYVQKLTVSAQHLLELINDILDLSKINAKSEGLNLSEIEVSALCRFALDLVRSEAERNAIRLEYVGMPGAPTFSADERRLRQVLVNLLDNAIKFSPPNSLVELSVSTENNAAEFLRFAVKDFGIGIAQQDLERIFEPFEQLDQGLNRQVDGTGLGLNLVRQLVEMHGGMVEVVSSLGAGSTFNVKIPRHKSLVTMESENTTAVRPASKPGVGCEGLRVMLVEDNHFNRDTVESFLSAQGVELFCAEDGLAAVEIAQHEDLDIIIMDIQMPRLDGLGAIKRIRRQEKNKCVPIIALTALALTGDSERCLSAGANDYLAKPVKLSKLVEVIQRNLREHSKHD
jgi:PAS domain S-box-containing protein